MRSAFLLAVLTIFGVLGIAWLSSPDPGEGGATERVDVTGDDVGDRVSAAALDPLGSGAPSSATEPLAREPVPANPGAGEPDPNDLGDGGSPETSGDLAEAPVPGESPPALASISGALRHESGAFQRTSQEVMAAVHLDIVPCERAGAGPHTDPPAAQLTPVLDDDGGLREIAFTFDGLVEGQPYEITLSTVDHQRWSGPSTMEFAPNHGVEFTCFGEDESVPLTFVVTDAATGEPIDGEWSVSEIRITASGENGVLIHAAPLSLEDFPVDAELDFAIEADGYRSAYGNRSSFDRDPATGALTAEVALERGFGARLVVLGRDPDRVLAIGAEVRIDGAFAGRTDGSGSLVVAGNEVPDEIDVRWRGQRLTGPFTDVLLTRRSGLRIALLEEP